MSRFESENKPKQPEMQFEEALKEAAGIFIGSNIAHLRDYLASRSEVWSVNQRTAFVEDPLSDAIYAPSSSNIS
jgi:hypothetical protein